MDKIVLFESKDKCCACGACMNICPKNAISMVEDEYGFLYPQIDDEKCVRCGACKKVCAYQNVTETNTPLAAYAAVNKNREQKMKSASGGIFAAMATKVLEEGGVVFGATLEKQGDYFNPHHIMVDNIEELYKLQGSKYVQSAIGTTYTEVREQLKLGREVLFSGTPCQVAGLKSFLKADYTNLITVDLICHGVPNARMFNDYLSSEMKKLKAKDIVGYSFRDKVKGWGMNTRIDYLDQKGIKKSKYKPARLASYNTLFLDGLIYRDNCYSCKYACNNRPGDFTIGDYWGIEREHPELLNKQCFVEKDGISCIIANTAKSVERMDSMSEFIALEKSEFEKVARKNGQLKSASHKNQNYSSVMDTYKSNGYTGIDLLFANKYKKQIIMHRIFNMLPRKVRLIIKHIKK